MAAPGGNRELIVFTCFCGIVRAHLEYNNAYSSRIESIEEVREQFPIIGDVTSVSI